MTGSKNSPGLLAAATSLTTIGDAVAQSLTDLTEGLAVPTLPPDFANSFLYWFNPANFDKCAPAQNPYCVSGPIVFGLLLLLGVGLLAFLCCCCCHRRRISRHFRKLRPRKRIRDDAETGSVIDAATRYNDNGYDNPAFVEEDDDRCIDTRAASIVGVVTNKNQNRLKGLR
ncbi:hypothetical protein [Cyprinid herpesvirus 3]|uniref:Uncharacterized protein n=1 Tax=Cyprinid herpesvirus 3 TaxID=180230 RepID=A3QMU8_CYHV3|nr:hypothetical protein [Cyprinid herpesvirus 3]